MTNIARTGQSLLIAASSMLFAAFTSALVVRRAIGGDWVSPPLPYWIWLTLPLAPLASWWIHRGRTGWAMAAGVLLVALQLAVLAQLRLAVIGEAFCAVLTAAHAVHAAAGVAALGRFGVNAGLFWHFAGLLWLYLLFLLGVWA
ncbi:MAG TPA: hypothetical protein VFQ91_00235 [Bryobacteraceae bacterium]|nr:hypothetical protein [Bryobacteraceae bacterium]